MVMLVGLLSACVAPEVDPTPLPNTDTATITPTITATINWFPATATPTLKPTEIIEPTPEMRPGVGSILITDLLASGSDWGTQSLSAGNITLGNDFAYIGYSTIQSFFAQPGIKKHLAGFLPGNRRQH